jgi:outer membrane protein assembly factor BamE (lipoprotein component of BamABCDE complex)
MTKFSVMLTAIALCTLTLSACNKPNTATSPTPEAASSPTTKVVKQQEEAAQQQVNKLEQKRTQVQGAVMESEQQINQSEQQAK